MSGHLRAPSEKEPLVSIKEDTGWVPEKIWKFWRRKFLACLGNRPTVARSASFFFWGGDQKITLLTLCYICFLWINK
jgi:hypothetical protein